MIKKITLLLFVLIIIICMIIYPKNNDIDKKIPYIPIDYNNVDKVSLVGLVNKSTNAVDNNKIVKSINKIISYKDKAKPVNHSTPDPIWSIIINMKDNESIIIYKDSDGVTKISNWVSSEYIIDSRIIQKLLNENNLQIENTYAS